MQPRKLALLLLLLSACGAQTTEPTTTDAGYHALIAPPSSVNIGVCVDGSASTDQAWVASGLTNISNAFGASSSPNLDAAAASRPVPATHIVIRQISSRSSTSSSDELLNFVIGGFPGLTQEPDVSAIEVFAEHDALWRLARRERDAAVEVSNRNRVEFLSQFSSLKFENHGSEVAGCVTALRDSFAADADVHVFLLTDLQQRGVPQVRGAYSQVQVVVAHICSSDASICDQQETDFKDLLLQLDIRNSSFVTVSQLQAEVEKVLVIQ